MSTRREIIRKVTLLTPLIALPGTVDVGALARRITDNCYETLATFFEKYPTDLVDRDPTYLTGHSFTDWHNEIHPYIQTHLAQLIPANGKIVELGVFQGVSAQVLKTIFGERRYMGVDIHPYGDVSGVVYMDVRDLADLKDGDKAAFVWNDLSTWKGSPRSRLSALSWAKRNLASGGIYMDEGAHAIPADANYDGLELIHRGHNFTVFRKV